MLQEAVYPYEYVDGLEKFNETLRSKEDFYSHLNLEDSTDACCAHVKGVC